MSEEHVGLDVAESMQEWQFVALLALVALPLVWKLWADRHEHY